MALHFTVSAFRLRPDYSKLAGLTVGPGFRSQVTELLGGTPRL
jgi:Protein of unknown function (DUF2889)